MIDHNNRRINDNSQRHGYSRQGIDVDIKREQVIEYHRHQDIDNQRRHNHQQVAHIAAHHQHKQQQDSHTPQRAVVNLLQLILDAD